MEWVGPRLLTHMNTIKSTISSKGGAPSKVPKVRTVATATLQRGKLSLAQNRIGGRGHNDYINDSERFVIFNTRDDMTVQKMYSCLEKYLSSEFYRSVSKVQKVWQKNGSVRFDLWIKTGLAQSFKRRLTDSIRPGYIKQAFREEIAVKLPSAVRWRVDVYRSWRDRAIRKKPVKVSPPVDAVCAVATLNINGIRNKLLELTDFLTEEDVSVCAVQETLEAGGYYVQCPEGYRIYSKPKTKGFRGHAILVKSQLTSHLEKTDNDHIIHVKVSGLGQARNIIHVVGCYLPSGGNFRRLRTIILDAIHLLCTKLIAKNPDVKILVMGDMNDQANHIDNCLNDLVLGLKVLRPRGSDLTRFPKRGKSSAIDHIICNEGMRSIIRRPRVARAYAISDHRPLVANLRLMPGEKTVTEIRYRIDADLVKGHGGKIVMHPKWCKPQLDGKINTGRDLDEFANEFIVTMKDVTTSLGIRKATVNGKPKFPRGLKQLLKIRKSASVKLVQARLEGALNDVLERAYIKANHRFVTALKEWKSAVEKKELSYMCREMRTGEHKKLWQRITKLTGTGTRAQGLGPVNDKRGVLQTDPKKIMETIKVHYEELANSEPGTSQDEKFWREKVTDQEVKPMLEGINSGITWPDVLLAIRAMTRGTAPGQDEISIDVLKELLAQECKEQVEVTMNVAVNEHSNIRRRAPLGIRFALEAKDLPKLPLTNLGKTLYKLIEGCWQLEQTPKAWDQVDIVNLFKGGDEPELLTNYRGISLISVGLKVLLTILGGRLMTSLTDRRDLVSEQAGYRPNEEAIGQYVAMAEIIRRKVIDEGEIYGVFVDFRKAFDKVYHEALYRVLDDMGVRGKMLNFIKYMYRNARAQVKVGEERSESFGMARGTRQGCPLSPLLFIIFVNSIFKECPAAGVESKGYTYRGGQFADDLLALTKSLEATQGFLDQLRTWCLKWGMEINLGKSGVMRFNTNGIGKAAYEDREFSLPEGLIPKVTEYKYLGIVMTPELSKTREGGDELAHSKNMANKGKKVVATILPLLRDPNKPVVVKAQVIRSLLMPVLTFGGEWTGFKAANSVPGQAVLKTAVNLVMGAKMTSSQYNVETLMYELNINSVEAEQATKRARLMAKCERGEMKTSLQHLFNRWFTSRSKTIITGSNKWIADAMTKSMGWGDAPYRGWKEIGERVELHNRSNCFEDEGLQKLDNLYESIAGTTLSEGAQRQLINDGMREYSMLEWSHEALEVERQQLLSARTAKGRTIGEAQSVYWAKAYVNERRFRAERTSAWSHYNGLQLGATRDWLRGTLSYPHMQREAHVLVKIRVLGYHKLNDRVSTNTRIEGGSILVKDECPLCAAHVGYGMEWAHLLTDCTHPRVSCMRDEHLKLLISVLRTELKHQSFIANSNTSVDAPGDRTYTITEAIQVYLIGGRIENYTPASWFGFGHLPFVTPGFSSHWWTHVAKFLYGVMKIYYTAVFPKGITDDVLDPILPNSGSDSGESDSESEMEIDDRLSTPVPELVPYGENRAPRNMVLKGGKWVYRDERLGRTADADWTHPLLRT